MQKKYSSDDDTVHLTRGDLNSPVSIMNWIRETFPGVTNLSYQDVVSALDGIFRDKNFISLPDEKRHHFKELINKLRNTIEDNKKLP
jgi:hypothetical protein